MIAIDESRCNLCGLCVPVCVRRILTKGEKSILVADPSLCLECGHCKAVCPTDAPQLPGMNEQFQTAPLKEEIPGAADLFRFFRRRRSLRVYRPDPVEKEKLKMLIEAGRYAPTGSNRQACEYLVVSGRKILDQVCALATQALQEEGGKFRKAWINTDRRRNHCRKIWIPSNSFLRSGNGSQKDGKKARTSFCIAPLPWF